MDVRLANADDIAGVVDVAAVADPPSEGVDVDPDYYTSILEHGRLVVAETSGVVVGYCGAIPIAGTRHVSDLFVHPDAHGHGIGRDLLDAVWDSSVREAPRQTFSSTHRSALPLYIRAGMQPRWPLLFLEGDPAAVGRTYLSIRDVDAEGAAEVEEVWFGWSRIAQYRFWSSRPDSRTFAVVEGDTPVAVGCLSRSRAHHTLLHLGVVDKSVMPDAIAAAATLATDSLMLAVAGSSAVVPRLVDVGWRIIDHDLYCASEPELIDAERLVPHPGFL